MQQRLRAAPKLPDRVCNMVNGELVMEAIVRSSVRVCVICLTACLVTVDALAADKLTNNAMAALIEELVLTEKDTFPMDGRSYLRGEALTRINEASSRLVAAGKDSWPQLFAHLQDKRPSTPSAEVTGPYYVGQKCCFLLRDQVMDFPKGYPYQKTLADHRISFRPSIASWLTRRQERSLDEIRYEVLAILIDMESYANNEKAVALLEGHLPKIEARIEAAAQGQQRQSGRIPR
jgi:hypothetical protein